MKIAIYHNLPSGGGKRTLFEQVRLLKTRHDLEVYSLTCAEHDFCDVRPFCKQNVTFPFQPLPLTTKPFGRLNQVIRLFDLFRLRFLQKRIASQIDSQNYDVIFVHICRYSTSPSLLSFLQTPSAYYCQEPPRFLYEPLIPRPYSSFSRPQRILNLVDPLIPLYRAILARQDHANVAAASSVIANSAYSRESLYRTYGIFAQVCYLGVNTERFQTLQIPKANFVLSVGALGPHKGFDFILRSLALLDATRRPPFEIVTNQDDPHERAYLQGLASQLGVQMKIHGLVNDDRLMAQYYNQALLTLYAPIMEPFGLVSIESMACGTPVIGVREGGIRESVVDGETGILTDRDPQQFASAITRLLEDKQLCARYGQQAREYVSAKWTWETSGARLEQLLFAASTHGSQKKVAS